MRRYRGAADVQVHKLRPVAWYQLNPDTPNHWLLRLQGAAQSAMLPTLTTLSLFIHFPLIYPCLFCSPFLSSVREEKRVQRSVSAHWCKWTFEMTEGDVGLSAGEDASEAKWRTIRETVIRCMHVDRATWCSPWTVWCHLLRRAITQWEHSIKLQSNSSQLTAKSNLCIRAHRKVLWPPHPVNIHAQQLAITLMPSHFSWHSCIGQDLKQRWWTECFLSRESRWDKAGETSHIVMR